VLNAVFDGREPGTRKIVTTCPHCLNTLGREYPQLDGHYEVVHHTQLLNRLVREGKLVPVAAPDAGSTPVTYHDPCYLGRHNEIYAEPRSLVGAAGATLTEMPRHADRSMCCGAGGARMWMEERIGQRVNVSRTEEAISTLSGVGSGSGAGGTIAVGCPFCRTMLSDGLTQAQGAGAGENLQIQDVSQLLLAAVQRGDPARSGSGAAADPAPAPGESAERQQDARG
jgi:Fe-S oxidoreductase